MTTTTAMIIVVMMMRVRRMLMIIVMTLTTTTMTTTTTIMITTMSTFSSSSELSIELIVFSLRCAWSKRFLVCRTTCALEVQIRGPPYIGTIFKHRHINRLAFIPAI